MKWEKFPFKIEKSCRLGGWDYSKNGIYFVTICTQDRLNLFRNVGTDPCVCSSLNKIRSWVKPTDIIGPINEIGKMIEKWWMKIPYKFKDITLDKYVIMPNHVHGILIIKNNFENKINIDMGEEQTHGSVPTTGQNTKFGNVGLLGQSIQWFKTMSTNEYIKNVKENKWQRFSKRLWQPRYHDRITRNEKELWIKRIYIENNPMNWNNDRNNM